MGTKLSLTEINKHLKKEEVEKLIKEKNKVVKDQKIIKK